MKATLATHGTWEHGGHEKTERISLGLMCMKHRLIEQDSEHTEYTHTI
jgi:hypothetical protein